MTVTAARPPLSEVVVLLSAIDNDPQRGYTQRRNDLPRLVRRLRHRGFANVTVTTSSATVKVSGIHRLTGATVELTLSPVRPGELRTWNVVMRDPTRQYIGLDSLWVGTKYRWRALNEYDTPGHVAATAERMTRGWARRMLLLSATRGLEQRTRRA